MNQQNMARATGVVLLTAAVCAFPYALIVKALNTNFSYLSIGVGLAVGFAAHKVGKASGIAIGIVAALATFAASLLGDCLAIKWVLADTYGFDITLTEARHAVRPMSYLIFAIGGFVAFGAAGGRRELRERSAASGAGRFTPDMMGQHAVAQAIPPAWPPAATDAVPAQPEVPWGTYETPVASPAPTPDGVTPDAPTPAAPTPPTASLE
ncbi:MAG: hypothetical protein QOG52_2213 [Frankiaceae bacterium]|nr:hypothetical protein [Frankiaceae bacterium]